MFTSFELPCTTEASLEARRALVAVDGALPDSVKEDVLLLLTELVTNAVLHADAGPDAPVRLEVDLTGRRVRVTVFDRGPGFTPRVPPRDGASHGWGLWLVDRVADGWGVTNTEEETGVWFEMAYGR